MRNLVPEPADERRVGPVERHLGEAMPDIEGGIERYRAEGRQGDTVAAALARGLGDGLDQCGTDAAPAMVGMDGEFAEPLGRVQLFREGKADRLVGGNRRDQRAATEQRRTKPLRRRRRLDCQRGVAMVGEKQPRRRFDRDQPLDLVEPGGANRIADGRICIRQASKPSTMTISASATVWRIFFAAWYSSLL